MKQATLDDILVKPQEVSIPVYSIETINDEGVPEYGSLKLWIRPARSVERDLAAAAARKESRTLRKKLNEDGSEERENLILSEIEDADIDSLRDMWVNQRLTERSIAIRKDSLENREYIPEPEGDDVTSKELDEYEDAVEESEKERELNVVEIVRRAREELEAEANAVEEGVLRQMAVPELIESILTRSYQISFIAQLIFRCTYTDKKLTKPAFKDIEQVYNLEENALTTLSQAHMSYLIDPERVKNLAGGLKSLT